MIRLDERGEPLGPAGPGVERRRLDVSRLLAAFQAAPLEDAPGRIAARQRSHLDWGELADADAVSAADVQLLGAPARPAAGRLELQKVRTQRQGCGGPADERQRHAALRRDQPLGLNLNRGEELLHLADAAGRSAVRPAADERQ